MKPILPFLLLIVTGCTSASNSVQLSIENINYIIDGDTFVIKCVKQFKCVNGKLSIRALALDTPEMRGECQYEKDMARAAKQHLVALKNRSRTITITPNHKRPYDRYNRLLASVSFDGVDWAESIIRARLGRPWDGRGGRWCS